MYTNKFNLPASIFNAIANDPYSSGDSDITTTQLIDVPQVVALKKRYKDQIEEDVSERIWSLMGQAIHTILERSAGKDSVVEERYFADVFGWKISGQVDLVEGDTLVDFKCTSVWTYIYASRMHEWEMQANVNNWLRMKNGHSSVTKMKNILILRDWVKSKAGSNKYPMTQIVEVDLPLWGEDKAKLYVELRVNTHMEAQKLSDDELAIKFPCSDKDRWFNEKTGAYTRCEQYCVVGKMGFCKQWRRK